MFDLKREKFKMRLFLLLSIVFAIVFVAAVIAVVFWDIEPVKAVVPPLLAFLACHTLYRNSKKAIDENSSN